MILDTCFLIDLQKESLGRKPERAQMDRSNVRFSISVASVTEFLEGFESPMVGERLLRPFARVNLDSKIAAQAARLRRHLQRQGSLIGDFDILIASSALTEAGPLMTRDIAHFSKIPGLDLCPY